MWNTSIYYLVIITLPFRQKIGSVGVAVVVGRKKDDYQTSKSTKTKMKKLSYVHVGIIL